MVDSRVSGDITNVTGISRGIFEAFGGVQRCYRVSERVAGSFQSFQVI